MNMALTMVLIHLSMLDLRHENSEDFWDSSCFQKQESDYYSNISSKMST